MKIEEAIAHARQVAAGCPEEDRQCAYQLDRVIIGGTTGAPVYDLCSETGKWYKSMTPEDFYLTAEEAEKAVKEG